MVDYLEDTRKKNKSKTMKTNSRNGSTINSAHKKTTVIKVTKKPASSKIAPTKQANTRVASTKVKKGITSRRPKKTKAKVATTTRIQTTPYRTNKVTKTKAPKINRKEIIKDVSNREIKAFEQRQKTRRADIKKNVSLVFKVLAILSVLGIITYRYTLINAKLSEKESLKNELEAINKENAQLEVNIESGMNISMIEQLAKELLGMQKLDNNQKVYINLDKKDYTESSQNNVLINTDSWWEKFIKVLTGK